MLFISQLIKKINNCSDFFFFFITFCLVYSSIYCVCQFCIIEVCRKDQLNVIKKKKKKKKFRLEMIMTLLKIAVNTVVSVHKWQVH